MSDAGICNLLPTKKLASPVLSRIKFCRMDRHIKVTVTGADGAHRAGITAQETRILMFPDHVPRCFTLTRWQWEIYDRWESRGTGGKITDIAFKGVKETVLEISDRFTRDPAHFEDDLFYAVTSFLRHAAAQFTAQPLNDEQNDNIPQG